MPSVMGSGQKAYFLLHDNYLMHVTFKGQLCDPNILFLIIFTICDMIWENPSHVSKGETAKQRKLTT